MSTQSHPGLATSRRGFMAGSSLTVVGTITASGGLASCSMGAGDTVAKFSPEQFKLLTRLSDLLIPETDTPGAVGAGVPNYIEGLLSTWAKTETRQDLEAGLALLDDTAGEMANSGFADLDEAGQIEVLTAVEKAAFGKKRDSKNDQPAEADNDPAAASEAYVPDGEEGYKELKWLIHYGYYHSEVGCTQELQYELVPGPDARSDAPLAEVGRTWVV